MGSAGWVCSRPPTTTLLEIRDPVAAWAEASEAGFQVGSSVTRETWKGARRKGEGVWYNDARAPGGVAGQGEMEDVGAMDLAAIARVLVMDEACRFSRGGGRSPRAKDIAR